MQIRCAYVPGNLRDELHMGTIYSTIGKQDDYNFKIKNDKGEIKKYSRFHFIELDEELMQND